MTERKISAVNVNARLLSQKVISSILYAREFVYVQREPPDDLRSLIVFTSEMNKFIIHSACDFEPFPHLPDHNCIQTIRLLNDHGFTF